MNQLNSCALQLNGALLTRESRTLQQAYDRFDETKNLILALLESARPLCDTYDELVSHAVESGVNLQLLRDFGDIQVSLADLAKQLRELVDFPEGQKLNKGELNELAGNILEISEQLEKLCTGNVVTGS